MGRSCKAEVCEMVLQMVECRHACWILCCVLRSHAEMLIFCCWSRSLPLDYLCLPDCQLMHACVLLCVSCTSWRGFDLGASALPLQMWCVLMMRLLVRFRSLARIVQAAVRACSVVPLPLRFRIISFEGTLSVRFIEHLCHFGVPGPVKALLALKHCMQVGWIRPLIP
jgi:hypothetical protein